ncbi:MAG: hypothetical protein KGI49_03060 [Patescibacteria group bacterium]|nr:hypothetical protein [Patescibacteria group bacterium]
MAKDRLDGENTSPDWVESDEFCGCVETLFDITPSTITYTIGLPVVKLYESAFTVIDALPPESVVPIFVDF